MEKLLRKVKRVLQEGLPGSKTDLAVTVPSHKLGGTVVWKGFDGVDPVDRIHQVWDVLNARLEPTERQSVNVVLTLTPAEITAHRS